MVVVSSMSPLYSNKDDWQGMTYRPNLIIKKKHQLNDLIDPIIPSNQNNPSYPNNPINLENPSIPNELIARNLSNINSETFGQVRPPSFEREVKGLDLVRRDWCQVRLQSNNIRVLK